MKNSCYLQSDTGINYISIMKLSRHYGANYLHEADVLHMHTTGNKYKISSASAQIGAQVCTTPLKAPQCIFAHTLNSGG